MYTIAAIPQFCQHQLDYVAPFTWTISPPIDEDPPLQPNYLSTYLPTYVPSTKYVVKLTDRRIGSTYRSAKSSFGSPGICEEPSRRWRVCTRQIFQNWEIFMLLWVRLLHPSWESEDKRCYRKPGIRPPGDVPSFVGAVYSGIHEMIPLSRWVLWFATESCCRQQRRSNSVVGTLFVAVLLHRQIVALSNTKYCRRYACT